MAKITFEIGDAFRCSKGLGVVITENAAVYYDYNSGQPFGVLLYTDNLPSTEYVTILSWHNICIYQK